MIHSIYALLAIVLFSFVLQHARAVDSEEFTSRFADFKARSISHEERIASLLSKPPLKRGDYAMPATLPAEKETQVPPSPPSVPEVPYIPVPEYYEDSLNNNPEVSMPRPASSTEPDVSLSNEEERIESTPDELDEAYAALYDTEPTYRRVGYYFGPLVGLSFPEDGAVRVSGSHVPYDSDGGFQLGFNFGKDFGGIRVESEYSYLNHDASGGLEIGSHNFLARFILDKEISDLVDLRAGMGMGFSFVGIESTSVGEIDGVGFAYDFLIGLGYNFGENWGLNLDYRYFLTAANDGFDRLKSHAVIFSAAIAL